MTRIEKLIREAMQRRADAQELMVRSLLEALAAYQEIDDLFEQLALERDPDRMT